MTADDTRGSDEVLRAAPQLVDRSPKPAAHPDRVVVFVGHAELAVEGVGSLHGLEQSLERLATIADHDPDLVGAIPRSPQPVAVVARDRLGEAERGPEEIDGAGLAVVLS